MDAARCTCHWPSSDPAKCPFHGPSSADPAIPWVLTYMDKQKLRAMRIDPEDTAAIQAVRKDDEDRRR